MHIFLLSLCLLTAKITYSASDEATVLGHIPHRTEVFPIADYECLLAKAKEDCAAGRIPQYADGLTPPEAPSMEASIVLRPNPYTSRVFVSRSYEEYARQCTERGVPTRLVIGCGRLGYPGGETFEACGGHSNDYFTIDTCSAIQPDLLGDVFHMPEQAFRAHSWDFIVLEGIYPFFGMYSLGSSEEFLGTLARSLRPGGVWILSFNLYFFPSVLTIGGRTFSDIGATFAECKRGACCDTGKVADDDKAEFGCQRKIFREAGKMVDDETAVFASFDDVRATVNAFFVRRGFKSAIMRNTFLVKPDQKDFAFIAVLTGEDRQSTGFLGSEIDALVGDEFLPKLKQRVLEELALVIRG